MCVCVSVCVTDKGELALFALEAKTVGGIERERGGGKQNKRQKKQEQEGGGKPANEKRTAPVTAGLRRKGQRLVCRRCGRPGSLSADGGRQSMPRPCRSRRGVGQR